MKKILPSVLLIIISCSSIENSELLQHVSLNVQTDKSIEITSYSDSVYLQPLECPNNDAIVSKADRILFYDDRMLIVGIKSNTLSLFTPDGKFIKSTASMIGHGHNEYISLRDAALDEYDKRIYVLADIPRKLFVMDYDLNVKQTYAIDDCILEMTVDSTNLYFLCLNYEQTVFDLRTVEKSNPEGKQNILLRNDKICPYLFTLGQSMNICDRQCYVSLPFDNTIYHLAGGKVVDGYTMDFDNNWFVYNEKQSQNIGEFNRVNMGKIWCIKNINVSDSLILFSTNKTSCIVIDKGMAMGMVYSNNYSTTIPFLTDFSVPVQGKKNIQVYMTFPSEITRYVEAVHNNEYKRIVDPNVLRVAENYRDDSNPIFVICEIK